MSSNVTHPSHYNTGKIEVIEAIEDWNLNFHRGNVVKYTTRAGKKDPLKEVEDLEKAKWYLEREIERLRAGIEKREPVRPNDMNPKSHTVQMLDLKLVGAIRLAKEDVITMEKMVESPTYGSQACRGALLLQIHHALVHLASSGLFVEAVK